MSGYKKIEGFECYEINNMGNIRLVYNHKPIKSRLNKNGYHQVCLGDKEDNYKTLLIHRLTALTFLENPDNKPIVDHINNNRTDNHISNLRWATIKENCMNKTISKKNTSGVKGVTFRKQNNKWHAQIQKDGKNYHIGYFDNLEAAQEARINKANELFGLFAKN